MTDNLDEPLRTVADEIKSRGMEPVRDLVSPFVRAKSSFTASSRFLRLTRQASASVGTHLEDHFFGREDVGPRSDRGAEGHRFAIEHCWGLTHLSDVYTSR